MSPFPTSKGHLNPGSILMTRLPASDAAADLVRHYWIPQWDLPAGRIERQVVLGYPMCNVVVEADAITVSGPTTRVSHRDLAGRSWAVGALLRPATGPALLTMLGRAGGPVPAGVAGLVDREWRITGDGPGRAWAGLRTAVTDAMAAGDLGAAADAAQRFLLPLRAELTPEALLANRLQDLVETLPAHRVEELARELALSPRSVQRLTRKYLGLTPGAVIRRRRLQDAADEVRRDPAADLAAVALAHGYADHAHLTREFRDVLGFAPSQYRAGQADEHRARPAGRRGSTRDHPNEGSRS